MNIPFNRPHLTGREHEYMSEALINGHISGDGNFTKKCSLLLEERFGVPKALLTTSCTHALEMAALLLDIKPGDEVIVPSFTFVSTVNAFVLRGAKPVFCDIRPDTLNLDETLLPGLITDKTRAIVPVHYAGVGCAMDDIIRIASDRGIAVVEDNAHGLFGRYRGKPLGTFGAMATQSFHETKNLQCGEGGALLINDPSYIERAEIIREKGTNRSRFFRGEIDKYSWVDVGSSCRFSPCPVGIRGSYSVEKKKYLEQIPARACRLVNCEQRQAAHRAGRVRTGFPYVLPPPPFTCIKAEIDCFSQGVWNSQRLPLSPLASF
jgi:dTDP-4-amino-4,6-dideoxygalactose transaminase